MTRLASGAQLWRCNVAGLLRISEPGEPLTAETARALIASLVAQESRQPAEEEANPQLYVKAER
jgi:hypothetical protein